MSACLNFDLGGDTKNGTSFEISAGTSYVNNRNMVFVVELVLACLKGDWLVNGEQVPVVPTDIMVLTPYKRKLLNR